MVPNRSSNPGQFNGNMNGGGFGTMQPPALQTRHSFTPGMGMQP